MKKRQSFKINKRSKLCNKAKKAKFTIVNEEKSALSFAVKDEQRSAEVYLLNKAEEVTEAGNNLAFLFPHLLEDGYRCQIEGYVCFSSEFSVKKEITSTMIEKVAQISQFKSILKDFPKSMKFCFAYGSGVFKQKSDPVNNMLDLIFVVRNPYQWHAENMTKNPSHYAQPLAFFGHKAVTRIQESWGAKVFYNTLIQTSEGRNIKYGVISEISLVEDLLDWNVLYLAGRLHKPVEIIVEPDKNSQLRTALVQNLHSAVNAALILLPEHFTEIEFYRTIAGLSYNGDFRMIFGEDKEKVSNIVVPQLKSFRELYAPILKHFEQYVEIAKIGDGNTTCHQDLSPESRIHHLNQLPRNPQVQMVRNWSQGPRSKDTEDCLRAIAHDPDSSELLDQVLRNIVWKSSVSQSLKGIVTAGVLKSVKYSGAKIVKMLKSTEERKQIMAPIVKPEKSDSAIIKSETKTGNVIKTQEK